MTLQTTLNELTVYILMAMNRDEMGDWMGNRAPPTSTTPTFFLGRPRVFTGGTTVTAVGDGITDDVAGCKGLPQFVESL